MGKTNSKHSEVTDTGVVNSNFIVEEGDSVPLDLRILAYVAVIIMLVMLGLKLRQAVRRGMKRDLTRSMLFKTQTATV